MGRSNTNEGSMNERKIMIETDPDYIASKRFDYSLNKLLERYPDGCPDRIIATALMIDEEEVEILYQNIVLKLRSIMGVET